MFPSIRYLFILPNPEQAVPREALVQGPLAPAVVRGDAPPDLSPAARVEVEVVVAHVLLYDTRALVHGAAMV